MNNIPFVDVYLQNKKLGKIALTSESLCAFEYDSEFLGNGVSISPFYLPLKAGVFIAKRNPFDGNFGVFDDSLPDGWGSLLLDRYLAQQGIDSHQLSILQRLSLVGKYGRGALEYIPDNSSLSDDQIIQLDRFAEEAENILNSNYTEGSLDLMYRYGGSSGGARPKVFIKIEEEDWLIKFKSSMDPNEIGQIEYRYSLLAKECGIEMPETRLFEGKYFGVKRFDRQMHEKQHVISAAALLNADFRIPNLDYLTLLSACFHLTRKMEEVYKLFRLMVFNVLIGNKDDHVKNFSFILKNKEWFLSPAYDILPSNGFNGFHTSTVNGNGVPTELDFYAVADKVGLKKNRCKAIFEEIKIKIDSQNL